MFYVSVAATAIDPEAYAWLVFTRATKMRLTGYNQRHVLILSKGDVFGIRRTRSNTYQIVKSDALHVLYRNIPPNTQDRILTNSIPYKGEPITPQEVEDGFSRHRRVSTQEPKRKSNRRIDDFFVPTTKRIVEKFQIDQNNYQWRKLTKGNIRVVTKKQGKSKAVLQSGSIVGLRYRSPGRGGYVLLDGNVRIQISHEMYSELVHASRVLPESQQKTEIVDLGSGLSAEQIKKLSEPKPRTKKEDKVVEEEPEEEIPTLYDLDDMSEEEILDIKRERKSKHKRNLRRMVRKLLEVQNQDVWVDDDSDFDDESSPGKLKEEDELEDVDSSPKAPADDIEPESEDEDLDEGDEGDDEGDDEDFDEDEEDLDEDMGDASFREDEHVADVLEPGAMFVMKKGGGRTFVVIEAAPMERNENLMEYILHDPKSDETDDDFNLFRLRLNVNTTLAKFEESAEILDKTFGEDDLKSIQDTVEYADVKSVSLVK